MHEYYFIFSSRNCRFLSKQYKCASHWIHFHRYKHYTQLYDLYSLQFTTMTNSFVLATPTKSTTMCTFTWLKTTPVCLYIAHIQWATCICAYILNLVKFLSPCAVTIPLSFCLHSYWNWQQKAFNFIKKFWYFNKFIRDLITILVTCVQCITLT